MHRITKEQFRQLCEDPSVGCCQEGKGSESASLTTVLFPQGHRK